MDFKTLHQEQMGEVIETKYMYDLVYSVMSNALLSQATTVLYIKDLYGTVKANKPSKKWNTVA